MNAVIYCRVSSKDQVDGTSLESQELACRDYAKRQGLAISRVFIEEGESAKFADRTQLLELLSYCKDKNRKIEILLVWKIDRFARNVEDHYTIKGALKKLGVQIVSVTEPIQSDPNGKLMETILAGFAQFDNDIRALRSVQGMQQRLQEGIWPWMPPLGYIPPKLTKKTRPDLPDPSNFEPIRKAWLMFASGAYTKADIIRLLHMWGVQAYRGRLISPQTLDRMFSNRYYAGVLRDPWTGREFPGGHQAMVTEAEFARVQQTVSSRRNQHPYHRVRSKFPLRGLIRCPSCEMRMTGYVAQGKRQRYAYYKCFKHNCLTRSKSYDAAAVHDEFSQFLEGASIPYYLASAILTEVISAYSEQMDGVRSGLAGRQDRAKSLKAQLHELVLMRTAHLVSDDEFVEQRDDLRHRLLELQASEVTEADTSLTPGQVNELASALSDLQAIWESTPTPHKRALGELFLPVGYVFRQIRTPEKGLLITTFEAFQNDSSHLAAHVRANLNTIIPEIRRFLAIIHLSKLDRQSQNEAA